MTETHLATIDSFRASIPAADTERARRDALEELYCRHSRALYKIALRKLGNPADAEDALQDGLLSAFKHFDQFKGDAQISTWLTSIVLNAARMQLRYRSRRRFVSLDEPENDEGFAVPEVLADAGPDPEESLRRTQVRQVLERSMAKLSPKIRLAFRLRILEGLTTQEAAERMGVSEGTLKAQFFRARTRITPLLRRALVSPPKTRKRVHVARVREISREAVTISPERSRYRHVA
ncbi:MAG TPA: sigma-70 family RNA polymerase sigma factor [Candidatus Acidoferrum sp.]